MIYYRVRRARRRTRTGPRPTRPDAKTQSNGIFTTSSSKQLILKLFQQHKTRKAKNCSKSAFSGLWTEFQRHQPINTKCACQILPQPRKAKSSFRGCGRIWQARLYWLPWLRTRPEQAHPTRTGPGEPWYIYIYIYIYILNIIYII